MKKPFFVFIASLLLLAGCRNAEASSTPTSVSSSASLNESTSLGRTSSEVSFSSRLATTASESTASITDSSTSEVFSSEITLETVTFLPEHFPTSSQGYPAPATLTLSHHIFTYEDTMKTSANPQDKDGNTQKNVSVDIVQMKADSGGLSASETFPLKSLQVVVLDNTSAYNVAYSQPRLYYGNSASASPLAKYVGGSFVSSFTPEGYKIFVGTYVLPELCSNFKLLADASSVEGQSRAFKGLSITLNPIL